MTRLLFIHGIGQEGRSENALEVEWLKALNQGLESSGHSKVKTALVPFYGDALKQWAQGDAAHPDSLLRGASQRDYSSFALEFAADVTHSAPVVAAQAAISAFPSGVVDGDAERRGIQNNPLVIDFVRMLDNAVPSVASGFISKFLRTVYCYLTIAEARNSVDEIVAKKLGQSDEPIVVVGHSLGSVVAYHVLQSYTAGLVLGFITVGSPLGIRAVRSRLQVPPAQSRKDLRWYNAFDHQDIVALNPLDVRHFPVRGPIENNGSIENSTDNHHGIEGYLGDKGIARRIASTLKLAGQGG